MQQDFAVWTNILEFAGIKPCSLFKQKKVHVPQVVALIPKFPPAVGTNILEFAGTQPCSLFKQQEAAFKQQEADLQYEVNLLKQGMKFIAKELQREREDRKRKSVRSGNAATREKSPRVKQLRKLLGR